MASGELQGWYQDPFGVHEKRYMSAGRPTKLVRDGQVDSYDEPPSTAYGMAAVAAGEQDLAPGGAATQSAYTAVAPGQGGYAAVAPGQGGYAAVAPGQGGYAAVPMAPARAGDDLRLPRTEVWSLWSWYGRAILTVAVMAVAAILTVIAFGGGSREPSWAKSLGDGVVVDAPASASPGHGSPGAAVDGLFAAIEAKNWAALCEYVRLPGSAPCTYLSAQGANAQSSIPDVRNFALGYTAIDGHAALVGTTGMVCQSATTPSASCSSNNDPAAILSSGKPFTTLWTGANNTSTNTYSLIPCVQVGSSWYVDELGPS